MDLLFIIISFSIFVGYMFSDMDYNNKHPKRFIGAFIISVLLLVWVGFALVFRTSEPVYLPIQNITDENGQTFQVVTYDGRIVNITERNGVFYDSSTTQIRSDGLSSWSLGLYCVIEVPKYNPVDIVRLDNP